MSEPQGDLFAPQAPQKCAACGVVGEHRCMEGDVEERLGFRPCQQYVDDLRAMIRWYRHWYYDLSTGRVSDAHFDILFSELEEIEQRWPEYAHPESPTQHVHQPYPKT